MIFSFQLEHGLGAFPDSFRGNLTGLSLQELIVWALSVMLSVPLVQLSLTGLGLLEGQSFYGKLELYWSNGIWIKKCPAYGHGVWYLVSFI